MQELLTVEGTWLLWDKCLTGFLKITKEGKILAANPAACALLEYSEAELRTKTFQQITHPEDVTFDVEMTEETFLGKREGFDMKKRYLTKFGRILPVLLRVIAIRGESGEFICFLSQITPISHINNVETLENAQRAKKDAIAAQKRSAFWKAVKDYHKIAIFIAMGLLALLGYWHGQGRP